MTDRSESRPVWVAIVRPRTGCRKAPTYVPSMRWDSVRSAHIVHNSKPFPYGTVLFILPSSNSCPIITFQHGNVSSVADATPLGLASANPLTTFEQSNIRVSFLHDGALDDACEAVSPATRSGLTCFRYRCLGTTRLYRLHSAMMPSLLAKRLLDPVRMRRLRGPRHPSGDT